MLVGRQSRGDGRMNLESSAERQDSEDFRETLYLEITEVEADHTGRNFQAISLAHHRAWQDRQATLQVLQAFEAFEAFRRRLG